MDEIGHNNRAGARRASADDAGLGGGGTGRTSGHGRLHLSGLLLVALALLLVGSSSAWAASAPPPVNTSAPTLSGTPMPGQTLSCSSGSWSGDPSSFSYVWLRDGSPIAGQTASTYVVQSTDQGHSLSCRVTATNGGQYTIAGLPAGSYQISFDHPLGVIVEGNYLPQFFNGQPSAASANLVSVTAPSTVSGIDAELQPGGRIAGRVTSAATHVPIASVEVCARNGTLVFGSCTTTDAAGDYTIVGLPSGSYEVEAPAIGGVIVKGCSGKTTCPEQNYLGTGAEGVSVTAPNTTSGVDLEPQPGGRITGKVTDASTHTPLANVIVCAYEGEITEFQQGCATTDSTGEYAIQALVSMHYTLTLNAQACTEGEGCTRLNYLPQTIKAVSVTAPNTTTVDAELQPGGEIAGKVTDATTHAAISGASVCAVEEAAEKSSCVHTDAAGQYTVAGLSSGSYEVSFRSNEYQEAQTFSVSVTAPSATTGVNAELRPKPRGTISGKVIDAVTHAPIANIEACISNEVGLWGCPTTNSAGEYSLKLPSGSYKVVFTTTTGLCAVWGTIGCTEPNYLGQTVSGVSVTAPNATGGVDAELQPGGQITGHVISAVTHEGLAGVVACAYTTGSEPMSYCGVTNGGGGSASADSNALSVPAPKGSSGGGFTLVGKPSFNTKTDKLVFTFQFQSAGTLSWNLFFRTSTSGVAASLASLPGEHLALAQAASTKHRRARKCKNGLVRRRRKCVVSMQLFASGSKGVSAGRVTVEVPVSARALDALKHGHTLHVSGTDTFRSVLGTSPVTINESIAVQPSKQHKKHRKHHNRHRRR